MVNLENALGNGKKVKLLVSMIVILIVISLAAFSYLFSDISKTSSVGEEGRVSGESSASGILDGFFDFLDDLFDGGDDDVLIGDGNDDINVLIVDRICSDDDDSQCWQYNFCDVDGKLNEFCCVNGECKNACGRLDLDCNHGCGERVDSNGDSRVMCCRDGELADGSCTPTLPCNNDGVCDEGEDSLVCDDCLGDGGEGGDGVIPGDGGEDGVGVGGGGVIPEGDGGGRDGNENGGVDVPDVAGDGDDGGIDLLPGGPCERDSDCVSLNYCGEGDEADVLYQFCCNNDICTNSCGVGAGVVTCTYGCGENVVSGESRIMCCGSGESLVGGVCV